MGYFWLIGYVLLHIQGRKYPIPAPLVVIPSCTEYRCNSKGLNFSILKTLNSTRVRTSEIAAIIAPLVPLLALPELGRGDKDGQYRRGEFAFLIEYDTARNLMNSLQWFEPSA